MNNLKHLKPFDMVTEEFRLTPSKSDDEKALKLLDKIKLDFDINKLIYRAHDTLEYKIDDDVTLSVRKMFEGEKSIFFNGPEGIEKLDVSKRVVGIFYDFFRSKYDENKEDRRKKVTRKYLDKYLI